MMKARHCGCVWYASIATVSIVVLLSGAGAGGSATSAFLFTPRDRHRHPLTRQETCGPDGPLGRVTSCLRQSTLCSNTNIVANSQVLGDLYRIRMEGQDEGFVSAMNVPTFACRGVDSSREVKHQLHQDTSPLLIPQLYHGLEDILQQGPAFVLDHVLSASQCRDIIQACEQAGFADYQAGKNHHGALQLLVAKSTADSVAEQLVPHINLDQLMERKRESEQSDDNSWELRCTGLNRRWRVYKYAH